MIYFICYAVYILSAILWWKYINIANSKGGRTEYSNPSIADFISTFIPLWNSGLVIVSYLFYFPRKDKKVSMKFNRFFNIKKD